MVEVFETDAPLSFPQESLWFLSQLGDDGAYNEAEGIRIRGRLSVDALRQAFGGLVERHEVLRSVVRSTGGAPRQWIRTHQPVALPVMDLRFLPEDEREAELRRYAQREALRSFDLEEGPLYRFRLVQLAREEHVLLVIIHHLCGDGWSLGLLGRELMALYTAAARGVKSELVPLTVQYRDYASWQREGLFKTRVDQQVDYWKNKLAGLPPLLELPLDEVRPAVQRFRGSTIPFELGQETTDALRSLGRRLRATPYMTALAAFMILLHRYSRSDDIAVGSPFANRGRRAFEDLFGFFANTLVLRGDFSKDPTVEELITAVRATTLEAYEHADVPFEKVVEALKPERNLSYNPVFQVMFAWQPGSTLADIAVPDCTVESLGLEAQTAKFDLNLSVWDAPGVGLRGKWAYNSSLLNETTVRRMIAHYQRILEQIASSPDKRVSEIDLLDAGERQEMLSIWAAEKSWSSELTLHDRFSAHAAETPDAIAVVFERRTMTYRELDERSTRLARHLAARGVGPERLVAIYLERSLDMIVALLAVLKAGGAYLPLDPVYPTDRLKLILDDAGAGVVLTQASLLARMPETMAHTVCLDRDWAHLTEEAALVRAKPENAAYVIYTSGSTGVPKGVAVTHGNAMRLFDATDHWFHFGRADVWTMFHSCAFDFSVWEIWGALLYGGRLVVVPYLLSRSPEDYYRLLADEQVTILNQTPSAFQQLSRAEEKLGMAPELALRLVLLGGEKLDFNTLAPWFDRHGDVKPQVGNLYGITETTVIVTYRPLTRADALQGRGSRIGRPIPDLEIRILDDKQRLVPMGVPGELYVGGAGVARGYLNRPELNAYRFIKDPFDPDPNGTKRLYRSGDLVRPLPDGDIEYLGRIDHQVQLRGFRIELGEIEAAMTGHPDVAEAFTIVRPDVHGDEIIVAYYVPKEGVVTSLDELRRHVQAKVPNYMVPSALIAMPALPLTPNGKVDRKALPAPTGAGKDRPYVAPRSDVERALAELWAEVLKTSRVGIRDNFFDLGGHSLLAVRLLSRLEEHFKQRLPVVTLFQNPTIEQLAPVLEGSRVQPAPALVRLHTGSSPAVYCAPGSGGMVSALHALARLTRNSFLALERRGLDGIAPTDESVEAIALHALSALRKEQPVGPYWLAGHSFGAYVALEIARMLERDGQQVGLVAVLDMPAPALAPPARPDDQERLLDTMLSIMSDLGGRKLEVNRDELRGASLDAQIERLRVEMVRLELLAPTAGIDQVRGIVRVLQADERALGRYAPAGTSSFRIALFRTSKRWFDPAATGAGGPTWGWASMTSREVHVTEVPGEHGTMLAAPHVTALAAALNAALSPASAPANSSLPEDERVAL